jgi:hypothetical protein
MKFSSVSQNSHRPGSSRRSRTVVLVAILTAIVGVSDSMLAAIKVRVNADPTYQLRGARTWAWAPDRAGKIVLTRTPSDDPEAVYQRTDPIVREVVNTELQKKKLQRVSGTPDLTLSYHLLLTIGLSAQTLGQFLPTTMQWGLPPIAPATTAIEVIEQGALVIDMSANSTVVWRGIAEAQIKSDLPQQRREALLRQAVADILARFPSR